MKRLTVFLLGLLAISSVLADNYELPDLDVDAGAADCGNAQAKLNLANADLARLKQLIPALADLQTLLLSANADLKEACEIGLRVTGLAGQPGLFLQTQSKSKIASSVKSKIHALKSHMKKVQDDSDKFMNVINDKLDGVIKEMNQVATGSNHDEIQAKCIEVEAAGTDLYNFLGWASDQIQTIYINAQLPQRISYLEGLIDRCQISTASGSFYKYYDSTHQFVDTTNSAFKSSRFEDYVIKLDSSFTTVPSVVASVTGVETTSQFQSVAVIVQSGKTTTTDITIRVYVIANVAVTAVQFNWFAVRETKKSTVSLFFADYGVSNSKMKNDYNSPTVRTYTTVNNHNLGLTSPKAVLGIAGFSWDRQKGNFNLGCVPTAAADATTTVCTVQADTVIMSILAYIVTYDDTNPLKVQVVSTPAPSSIITATGTSSSKLTGTTYVSSNTFGNGPSYWLALNQINMNKGSTKFKFDITYDNVAHQAKIDWATTNVALRSISFNTIFACQKVEGC